MSSMSDTRRRALRRLAERFDFELWIGPDARAIEQLGGEEAAMRLLEAAWREISSEQVYVTCRRPWAWHAFDRPDLDAWALSHVEEAIALNAAGELSASELRAAFDAAEPQRSLDRTHGTPAIVRVVEALESIGVKL
jgi:hypothetical protein